MDHILGNYAGLVEETINSCTYPYSYLADKWDNVPAWRKEAKGRVFEVLAYNPPSCNLNPRLLKQFEYEGLSVELLAYDQPFGPPTEGFFLKPLGAEGKLPTVIALHDHGGFKYYGKEKLVAFPDEPEILREFKTRYYGGVSWATELAKRGYAVFAPDIFLWGSRKLLAEEAPSDFTGMMAGKEPGTREYIEAYHQFSREYETMVTKSLFLAGTTWPGIVVYENMRSVDYVLTRPDVDPARLGCGGLSGGGQQAVLLSGLDDRIRCGVCAAFMSTFARTVKHNIPNHSWMLYLPHLANLMDFPDLATLSGGKPFLVQFNREDQVWVMEGQTESNKKLQDIYKKMACPENYSGRFYPGSHKFDLQMQGEAFDWYDAWLS
jgi:dienelactone hydrolase